MKKLIAPVLSTCLCVGVVLAGPPQPSNDPGVVDTLRQLEQDMGDAMVRVDVEKLDQIYADDFATVGMSGKVVTKKDLLRNFESFHDKLESFENGPMDVQVFGDVAVVRGSVTEKRTRDGKDSSGEFVWMDLLEKRAGKWVVVRSIGARVKGATPGSAPVAEAARPPTTRLGLRRDARSVRFDLWPHGF
jgi:ketosteroid isomerase-like protein